MKNNIADNYPPLIYEVCRIAVVQKSIAPIMMYVHCNKSLYISLLKKYINEEKITCIKRTIGPCNCNAAMSMLPKHGPAFVIKKSRNYI